MLALKAQGQSRIPFIWFWPDGAPACAMMTHDIEGQAGLDFCDELMDIDDSYAIKSAFQLIPGGREASWRRTALRMRERGFEVNLHDLNHDGQLFARKDTFRRQAKRINEHAREFGCDGFRSGAMYREQQWFEAFEFSYDMSVPNAAHLEPQRGGCCTVMPYFVGDILELQLQVPRRSWPRAASFTSACSCRRLPVLDRVVEALGALALEALAEYSLRNVWRSCAGVASAARSGRRRTAPRPRSAGSGSRRPSSSTGAVGDPACSSTNLLPSRKMRGRTFSCRVLVQRQGVLLDLHRHLAPRPRCPRAARPS